MDKQLEEIRKRCDAATQGPWKTDRPICHHGIIAVQTQRNLIDWICHMQVSNQPNYTNDAAFIAHAREDIPVLLDMIESLQAKQNDWERDLDALHNDAMMRIGKLLKQLDESSARERAAVADMNHIVDAIENCDEFLSNGTEKVNSLQLGRCDVCKGICREGYPCKFEYRGPGEGETDNA
jgi:hypothetical protein